MRLVTQVVVVALVEREPKLFLPFLAGFYEQAIPFSWLVIRASWGIDLVVHGWQKVERLPTIFAAIGAGTAASLPAAMNPAQNITLVFLEFIGGICIVLGLFTRFFAAATAIEMAIITFTVFWSKGYHAWELTFWWGITLFAIALRGGGPYSLDRVLGRAL